MAEKKIDFNALGQAMDTTWGRSSTPKTASYSVKMQLVGSSTVKVSYAVIVNFGTERQMIEMKRLYEEESNSVINEVLKQVKKNYKDLADGSVSFKETHTSTGLEIMATSFHNPKRQAYYRRQSLFEVA